MTSQQCAFRHSSSVAPLVVIGSTFDAKVDVNVTQRRKVPQICHTEITPASHR